MSRTPRGRTIATALVATVAGIAGVAWCVALHALIVTGAAPRASLALIALPWVFVVGPPLARVAARASGRRRALVVIAVVAVLVACAWLAVRWSPVAADAEVALFVENAAFFVWLAALFASGLVPGHTALVTRLAMRTRGADLPPAIVRYTRRVTAAWAIFFVALAATSAALFWLAPRATWSLFVNLLVWPSIAAFFVVEYGVRRVALPDVAHTPLGAAIGAWRGRRAQDGDGGDPRP